MAIDNILVDLRETCGVPGPTGSEKPIEDAGAERYIAAMSRDFGITIRITIPAL
jgi:hypothetical protein